MGVFDKETQLLIKLTERLYRKSILGEISFSDVNIDRCIVIALKNNLLYYVAKKITDESGYHSEIKEKFSWIRSQLEPEISKIKNSIVHINTYSKNNRFIKTFRGYERIPSDVDVLVNDFDSVLRLFLTSGYNYQDYNKKEKSIVLLRPDQMKIHLHSRVTWMWSNFMDQDFIFENPRDVRFYDHAVMIPNLDADFLIHIAHINFEPLHINFAELLYLFSLSSKVNIDIIMQQAKKYCWRKTLLRTLNLINNFHYLLYNDLCFQAFRFKKINFKRIFFPYYLTRKHIISSVLEKRLFFYPLTKITKVIKVISSGDPYSGYYSPSENIKGIDTQTLLKSS